MTLALAIALPLVLGTLGPLVAARGGRVLPACTAALTTALSLLAIGIEAPRVFAGESVVVSWPWVEELGLAFSLRLDGLALLFALLIPAVGLLIILYAHYYLGEDDPPGKFYSQLMLFMASMLGIALSNNLLLLAIFWELTSLSSFLLIGYWNQDAEARRAARMALAVTGGGGLAMLAGFLLLGNIAGTYEISVLNTQRALVQADARYPVALILILLGAFTKSAQFPFHFWLPEAMAAPTPVSAYLHSATMVKAGIFLVARLYPVLGASDLFEYTVSCVGLTTMVFGAFVAMFKHDLKGLLAYSTVSHLGLIMFLLGLSSPLSAVAAVFHILNHATFKGSLFMAAGIIDHESGSRDMRQLAGLWKYMPYTALLAMVAASAMAGVPLLNGFLSKEMFFAESLTAKELGAFSEFVPYLVAVGGAFSVAYSIRFIHDVFFHGEPKGLTRTPHEPPRFMKLPVEILVALCVVVGLAPGTTFGPLVDLAAYAVIGLPLPEYTIKLWHGFNLPLAMSAAALAGGIAIYWFLQRIYHLHAHEPAAVAGRSGYEIGVRSLLDTAERFTRVIDNGSLQRYVALLVGAVLLVAAWPFLEHGIQLGSKPRLTSNPVAVLVWLMVVAAALASVLRHRERLLATVLVAVVGLGTALAFVAFSAPDLALTQLSVEVVSTVLLLMGLAFLPRETPAESSPGRRMRDAALATAAGLGLTVLTYAVLTRPLDSIAWYFLENSVPKGGGSNVVNVILVDFRGYDTMGEITVLGIAALGVAAMLDGLRIMRADPSSGVHGPSADRFPLMLRIVARWLLPLALVVSVYIFFRGHNAPGGGFIAGLVTAVALVMQYLARGLLQTDARFPARYDRVVGVGLGIACATGIGSFFVNAPFLTSTHAHPHLPLLGEVGLASAALFDLGVYVTVVGATLLTLVVLGRIKPRRGTAEES